MLAETSIACPRLSPATASQFSGSHGVGDQHRTGSLPFQPFRFRRSLFDIRYSLRTSKTPYTEQGMSNDEVDQLFVRHRSDAQSLRKRKAAKRWQVIAWGEPTSVSEAGGTPGKRYASFETPSRRRFGGGVAAKSPPGDFRFRLTVLGLRNARRDEHCLPQAITCHCFAVFRQSRGRRSPQNEHRTGSLPFQPFRFRRSLFDIRYSLAHRKLRTPNKECRMTKSINYSFAIGVTRSR